MPDPGDSPLLWPVETLRAAYRRGDLSPVEVATEALVRSTKANPRLNAFLEICEPLALAQASDAERAYRDGTAGPLAGVPLPVKDTFPVAGTVTTYGSAVFAGAVAGRDSGLVARLRAAGAVFTGKTNAAEFGQSATTDNRLGDDCRNPWDLERTSGGSSGGATAAVAAGLANVSVGADGGGSIRIPAAFCGLFGFKPTYGRCRDEGGFRAMSDFISPGPFAWRVADARAVLEVIAGADFARRALPASLRVAWCERPQGRPVDPGLLGVVGDAVGALETLGAAVTARDLPLDGWAEVFGPLVLAEERRERGHLLAEHAGELTGYERKSLEAARDVTPAAVAAARTAHARYRSRIDALFDTFDLLVTPATAVPAFRLRERPTEIDGQEVDRLWGAFPFAVPFNVSGHPAAAVPCGLSDGLPVALQVVAARGADRFLLDVCEALEEALAFAAGDVQARWRELTA